MYQQPDYYETRRANKAQERNQLLSIVAGLIPKPKTDIEQLTEVLALQAKATQAEQDARRAAMVGGRGMIQPPIGTLAPSVQAPSLQQLASIRGAGAGGGLIPTGANYDPIMGNLSYSFGKDKAADKRAEDMYTQEKSLSGTGRFLEQFGRSHSELLKAYPEIGTEGYMGWGTRKLASVNTSLDKHPETKAFLTELQPLANQMARDVEGGRVTDQDRKIYADAFANAVKHPDKTNVRLASNALLKLRDRGGNIDSVVNELRNSDVDIIQNIAREIDKDELKKLKATIGRK